MSCEQWWISRINAPLDADLHARIRLAVLGKIVVGFELPSALRLVIAEAAHVLVELEISPIRFCDDLLLSVSSSDARITTAAFRERITEREIHWHAGLLRSRIGNVADTSIPHGRIAVLAAQTPADRALVFGNQLLSLADYVEELADLVSRHDLVLLRPHPHIHGEAPGLRAVLTLPGLRITMANSYRLLASGRVDTLIAISSSLLAEAHYFGVKPLRLGPLPSEATPMVRLSSLGGPIADAIAKIAGFDLDAPDLPLPCGGAPLQDAVGFNWAATDIRDARPALQATRIGALPAKLTPGDPAWTAALVYGWYPNETWGVWGTSFSVLSFDWPSDHADAISCILELRSPAIDQPQQVVSIWSDGHMLAQTNLSHCAVPITFEIGRPERPGPVQLWLLCDPLFCPAQAWPGNGDIRQLGPGLVGMELR